MTVEWGRDGPDLLVALDRDAGPLGVQIQDQLRTAIRDRRLAPGERLPSTRRMAELLGVSRGTVVEVYEQLLAEGYVESAVGSGTRVAAIPGGSALETSIRRRWINWCGRGDPGSWLTVSRYAATFRAALGH